MKKPLTILVLLLATPFSINTQHSSVLPLDKYMAVASVSKVK